MSERELICIGCPMGCPIVVKMEDGKVGKGSSPKSIVGAVL